MFTKNISNLKLLSRLLLYRLVDFCSEISSVVTIASSSFITKHKTPFDFTQKYSIFNLLRSKSKSQFSSCMTYLPFLSLTMYPWRFYVRNFYYWNWKTVFKKNISFIEHFTFLKLAVSNKFLSWTADLRRLQNKILFWAHSLINFLRL